jgi:hypothetical protein
MLHNKSWRNFIFIFFPPKIYLGGRGCGVSFVIFGPLGSQLNFIFKVKAL